MRPAVAGGWRTVVAKDMPGGLAYGLYSNTNGELPRHRGVDRRDVARRSTAPPRCRREAGATSRSTYDGTTLRLFVNGAQVAQLLAAGSLATSTVPLHIGGNGVWGEWFNGAIDEVRDLQPRAHRQRDPERHGPEHHARHDRADDPRADADAGRRGHQRRHVADGAIQRADGRRRSITRSTFQLKDAANAARPGDGHVRRRHEHRDADAAERAHLRRDVHGHRQGRRRRRHATSPATRSRPTRAGRSRSKRRRRRSSSSARPATASARTSARSSRTRA